MEDIPQEQAVSPSTEQLAQYLANDPRTAFPRRLREIRTQARLTQQQLADRMNLLFRMHRSAIAKIESGDRPVLLGEAVAFAQVLGVPLSDLLAAPGDADRERAHTQRLEAQLEVRSIEAEIAERAKLLEENRVLLENAAARLGAARRRLDDLGGPFTSSWIPGVGPAITVYSTPLIRMGQEDGQ
jgi:transcriptional regulator with XRE-family HTH domain